MHYTYLHICVEADYRVPQDGSAVVTTTARIDTDIIPVHLMVVSAVNIPVTTAILLCGRCASKPNR